jgi:hypothetical protein
MKSPWTRRHEQAIGALIPWNAVTVLGLLGFCGWQLYLFCRREPE